jgi:hypothetical protein
MASMCDSAGAHNTGFKVPHLKGSFIIAAEHELPSQALCVCGQVGNDKQTEHVGCLKGHRSDSVEACKLCCRHRLR